MTRTMKNGAVSSLINVGQTPMPFVLDIKRTHQDIQPKNMEKVGIAQPGSGLDKRQCTIQVTTRAEGHQPNIAIIFRGTGKCIREYEKAAWHPGVDVHCQANTWADTLFSLKWVVNTLSKSVAGIEHFVLFVDNLTAQQTEAFKEKVASLNGVVCYGLKNSTDLWQVVDAGIGHMLKVLVGQEHRYWLGENTNAERISVMVG